MHGAMIDSACVDQLAAYRLERDLTYEALANEMNRAGISINMRSLHLALTKRAKPRERTLYKINRYIDYLDGAGKKKTTRGKKARRPAAAAAMR
jgi:hypothetical protein